MLYAHILMWNTKMAEVLGEESVIDKNMNMQDLNQKRDKDFVYF